MAAQSGLLYVCVCDKQETSLLSLTKRDNWCQQEQEGS